jgi:hypothetical protein
MTIHLGDGVCLTDCQRRLTNRHLRFDGRLPRRQYSIYPQNNACLPNLGVGEMD